MHPELDDYYWIMAGRNRLIAVDEGRTALCTFFVLNDEAEIPQFYDRKCWTTPLDHEDGTIIYFDKLVAKTFNKAMWVAIEQEVTTRFPTWTQFVWYRPRPGSQPDRQYVYRRRADV